MFQYNKADSENYNLEIYRASLQQLNIEAIAEEIIETNADISIIRIPAKFQNELYQLSDLGYNIVVADALAEYTIKMGRSAPLPDFDPRIEYVPGTKDNKEEIHRLLEMSFAGYTNHYKANPYLPDANILTVYKKWVDECIAGDGLVYLLKYDGENAAFFSGRIQNNCFMGGPGGVDSKFAGCGIYIDAHKRLPYLVAESGVKMCRTGTQIQNHTVQKQWALTGWVLSYTWLTVHVNSFLSACDKGKKFEFAAPKKLTLNWLISQLEAIYPDVTITASTITFHHRLLTSTVVLYVSDQITNYNNTDEALVTVKLTNNAGALLCIAQISIKDVA